MTQLLLQNDKIIQDLKDSHYDTLRTGKWDSGINKKRIDFVYSEFIVHRFIITHQ